MKKITILFTAVLVQLGACQTDTKMKKYEWSPTAEAPKGYPCEILSGNFYMVDGTSIYIPAGHTLMLGWGKTGAAHVVGPDFKGVPSSFDVKYISYLEEKVYGGSFKLPKEKCARLFEEGMIDNMGVQRTYGEFVLGVAPGGVMVVWMMNSGKTVEIDRYQAEEINIDIKDYKPGVGEGSTTASYLKKRKKSIINSNRAGTVHTDSIPFGLWDTYRKKYLWQPVWKFKAEGTTVVNMMGISYFNGESFWTAGTNTEILSMEHRAIPEDANIGWTDAKGNKYGGDITFDEAEIFKVFEKIYVEEQKENAKLVVEIDRYNSRIDAFLRTEDEVYPLEGSEFRAYPLPPR